MRQRETRLGFRSKVRQAGFWFLIAQSVGPNNRLLGKQIMALDNCEVKHSLTSQ